MAHNGFPIRVASLADPNVFGQLDASGCVVGGMNGESMFVSTDRGVESTIVETTSFGDSWTALFSPRSINLSKVISSVASYFFQVSATGLRWTHLVQHPHFLLMGLSRHCRSVIRLSLLQQVLKTWCLLPQPPLIMVMRPS